MTTSDRIEPLRVFLVRHGEVDPRFRTRCYGDLDVDLSPRGEEQTRALPDRVRPLHLAKVYSSDLQRAASAAALVAEDQGIPHEALLDLREVNRGAWANLPWEEIHARWPGGLEQFFSRPELPMPGGGENLADLAARVDRARATLLERHASGSVLVVAHAWVIRCWLARALDLPLERVRRLVLATASLSVVEEGPSPLVHTINLERGLPSLEMHDAPLR